MTDKVGIYVHVPFCRSKCHYCDFCSIPHADGGKIEAYTEALCREISFISEQIAAKGDVPRADTVYLGGGTPTLLGEEQTGKILDAVSRAFGICADAEITVEANPGTVDGKKLLSLRRMGVNRLSVGVQSAHATELRLLGRIHGFEDAKRCFSDARDAGFDNISADLMYGIPNQTPESFEASVEAVLSLAPEHVSSYCLSIEEGTVFHRKKDSLILPDEDTVAQMYFSLGERLRSCGYEKYEISNFALTDRGSRHNLRYWHREDYLGFGAAAHSCFANVRFAHSRDVDGYVRGDSTYEEIERIDESGRMEEYVMLRMRLSQGVSADEFRRTFGKDFFSVYRRFADFAPRYVRIDGDSCRFTDEGMFVSNHILSEALCDI